MYSLIVKIARLSVLGFMPLLMISSAGEGVMLVAPLSEGTHVLNLRGNQNKELAGNMSFEVLRQSSYKDENFNVLKLCFTSKELKNPYAMEILVSKKNNSKDISLGIYRVEDIESFLMPFAGVFGAFNGVEFGNRPFFATSGVVKLTHIEDNKVVGRLDLEFKDNSGNNFSITGGFNAN